MHWTNEANTIFLKKFSAKILVAYADALKQTKS